MSNAPKDTVRGIDWPDSVSLAIGTPLQPSVVYKTSDVEMLHAQYEGRAEGFTYSREGHPNATVLAKKVDLLEGATGGMMTGSGMSAITAVFFGLLKAGDHVLGGDQLYGRSLRMMKTELPRFDIDTGFFDPTDANSLREAIRPNTRMILVEVVSNPTLRVADMQAIYQIAREKGVLVVVDNTFTTPRGYRPFEHGADIVLHSVTKLLAGHSDAMLGYVAAQNPAHSQAIWDVIVTMGLTASPYDCWMAERGMHSFDLRFERACKNASIVATEIAKLPNVLRVLYPERSDHPDTARIPSIMGENFGNMVSFEIAGGHKAAQRLTENCDLAFAPTLGDVASTLSHPASSSHRGLTSDERAALGMSDGFFRLSVGIENPDTLASLLVKAISAAA
ncbi:MAG: aminotransferase class I/II-fold pyridoxal phosphate-dependent enzyme [Dinoroseobacter sp.]|nr:aminotransferase class I/II-fold pyridoxal phosphate-dependent enzyme [Dinoroseobacter sp.]